MNKEKSIELKQTKQKNQNKKVKNKSNLKHTKSIDKSFSKSE